MRRSFTVPCSSHLTCQKTSVLVGHHHPSLQSRSLSVCPPFVSCQLHRASQILLPTRRCHTYILPLSSRARPNRRLGSQVNVWTLRIKTEKQTCVTDIIIKGATFVKVTARIVVITRIVAALWIHEIFRVSFKFGF